MVEIMHKKIIKYLFLFFFGGMTLAMLTASDCSCSLALEGLNLWFLKMIPALLPFMILSGLLIGLDLSDSFASFFSPVLRPLFRLSDSCLYCIVIGFLCGFPMGARVCAQSYERKKISRREATLLLSFCNNIGPVYFTGYVLHLFPAKRIWISFLGMYGIPMLYGIFLRHTLFRSIPLSGRTSARINQQFIGGSAPDASAAGHNSGVLSMGCIFSQLNASILSALDAITVLGGYMIFCNLLNLLPMLFLGNGSQITRLLGPFFEITSGLARLAPTEYIFAYILLPFGGLSCIAQTYSCIRNTDLSLKEYVFHKIVQTMLTAAFYMLLAAC